MSTLPFPPSIPRDLVDRLPVPVVDDEPSEVSLPLASLGTLPVLPSMLDPRGRLPDRNRFGRPA